MPDCWVRDVLLYSRKSLATVSAELKGSRSPASQGNKKDQAESVWSIGCTMKEEP